MEDLLQQYPTREAFDTFFRLAYRPVAYDEVREGMEGLVREAGLSIFQEDYVKAGVKKEDFTAHLAQAARFQFEDAMTEAFYEKNPSIYETAFGLYELDPAGSAAITKTFHEEYQKSYQRLLEELFDSAIAPLL